MTDNNSIIKGGFFIYRANQDKSSRVSDLINETIGETNGETKGETKGQGEPEFSQTGEIVGMVVIKEYGNRTYFAYSPINQSDPNPGDLMTYFVDTTVPNPHDIDPTNVFDITVFEEFIQKMIS
jgi:hypothetical protein